MSWTTPAELRAQVQRLWDRGDIARAVLGVEAGFPRRLRLKTPTATDISQHFAEVRRWAAELAAMPQLRLEWRTVQHRVQGTQTLPREAWLDSADAAVKLLGRTAEARRLAALAADTSQRLPALQAWIEARPFKALELADAWPALMAITQWLLAHPRPGIYLRQVDVPGVDSKFIEAHRGVLAELFDRALPAAAINERHRGVSGFARRYGFRDKPLRIRLRLLDPQISPLPQPADGDLTLTATDFGRLNLPARRVFITENETNFLAFPAVPGGLVIFGAGYGWEALAGTHWLQDQAIYYWGDIDTHGFAILDRLRAHFPRAASLLMDRETLLAHQEHWCREDRPQHCALPRLTAAEQSLYAELCEDQLAPRLRLEQERIGFRWLLQRLQAL